MTSTLQGRVQFTAYRLVFLQCLGVSVIACIALLAQGSNTALAVICGGLAYCLPNFLFVWRVFRFVGAQQVMQFMLAFFFGEMAKMLISAILIILIVKYLPVSLLSVLVGLIAAIISFWIACIWLFSKQEKQKTTATYVNR
jgi:ATP synthase protein I